MHDFKENMNNLCKNTVKISFIIKQFVQTEMFPVALSFLIHVHNRGLSAHENVVVLQPCYFLFSGENCFLNYNSATNPIPEIIIRR